MTDEVGHADRPLRMQLSTDGQHAEAVIAVGGHLDLDGAPALVDLARSALEDHPQELVISIADATFVDSGGLRAILEIKDVSERGGTSFALRDVPPRISRLLEMTGLSHLVDDSP
jgi:anti-sigma B factor antagonist